MSPGKSIAVAIAISTVLVSGQACHKDAAAALPAEYQNLRQAQTATALVACPCFSALGYPSEATCLGDLTPRDLAGAQVECVNAVFAEYSSMLPPNVTCRATATQALQTCLNAVSACDPTSVDNCTATMASAVGACPAVDPAVQSALDACVGASPAR